MNQLEHDAKTRKHEKTHCPSQGRENMLLFASAVKLVLLIGLKELTMNSDWLEQRPEHVILLFRSS